MFGHPVRAAGRIVRRRLFTCLVVAGLAALGFSGAIAHAGEKGETLKEPKFQFIEPNGIRMRTVVEGKGPLVILLHGFP